MPTPGATQHQRIAGDLRDAIDEMMPTATIGRPGSFEPSVAQQLEALRREVAALREAIQPSPSPIIHGREALAAFDALQRRSA